MTFLGVVAFAIFFLYVSVMCLYLILLVLPPVLRVLCAIVAPFTIYPFVALVCFTFALCCRCVLWLFDLCSLKSKSTTALHS